MGNLLQAPVQLRELVISECYNFQKFPKSIGCLKSLKKLVLSNSYGNKMRSLPDEFCLLQSLEHLELSGCAELSSLPSSFGHLRNLRHLDLSNCKILRRLPVSFEELTLLQHLNLKGCFELTLESNILENMMKLEYFNLSKCEQLEELPRHITNQASLRELYLGGISRLREIPLNINQFSKVRVMEIGSELLTSLPTSLGDLPSLTSLMLRKCPKLECIPDSLGHLSLLEFLEISYSGVESLPKSVRQLNNLRRLDIYWCPISQLDVQTGSFASSLCSLKLINLSGTEVSKIFIPQDCCPGLETLFIDYNKHLTDIEVLPSTVKEIRVLGCQMVRSVWGIGDLLNIQRLMIIWCPELDALPSFAQLASLRVFRLQCCYKVKKIQGLEHCRALEELIVETRWEESGIESLERMERLRIVNLTAISRSAVEGCSQSLQKWPEEIVICTRAVPHAGLLVNSLFAHFAGLGAEVAADSDDDQNINSNGHGILVCFVVNCETPKTNLTLVGDHLGISSAEVEEGKWVWLALFSEGSRSHTTKGYRIVASPSPLWEIPTPPIPVGTGVTIIPLSSIPQRIMPSFEVEEALCLMGEEEVLVEYFKCLWELVPN